MFARPRPKKSLLPPPSKKRKVAHTIEDISFDDNARADYLTGFHKRKLQRIKYAQEEAARRERQLKIDARKQLREGRKREVEEHVQAVEKLLREATRAGGVDSEGPEEDHEDEYVDEDKYTTVTIESVTVSRDGLEKPEDSADEDEVAARKAAEEGRSAKERAARHPKKKKPLKFRYEAKGDRAIRARKEKYKNKKKRD